MQKPRKSWVFLRRKGSRLRCPTGRLSIRDSVTVTEHPDRPPGEGPGSSLQLRFTLRGGLHMLRFAPAFVTAAALAWGGPAATADRKPAGEAFARLPKPQSLTVNADRGEVI